MISVFALLGLPLIPRMRTFVGIFKPPQINIFSYNISYTEGKIKNGGGGGFGDPLERDTELVREDVGDGFISLEAARDIYKVKIFSNQSSSPLKGALGHKVIGALAIAYDMHGGQELTINMIHNWAMVQDMIVVGSGPQRPVHCYYGGACHQWPSSGLKAVNDKPDGLGLKSCRSTGMKVAEIAKIVVAGLETVGYEEPYKYLFEKGGFYNVKIKN